MSAALIVSSAILRSAPSAASSRWRTVPSITVSPIVATRPPITFSSTTTFTSTCLPVASLSASASAPLLRVVERDRRADLGDLVLARRRRELDEPVDDRRQVVRRARRRRRTR